MEFRRRIDGELTRMCSLGGETWEQCEEKIQNIVKEKPGLESINIERADHSKGKTSSNKPRTIFVSFSLTSKRRRYLRMQGNLKVTIFF